eukprot:Gb_01548 [translate_table: standard]
MKRFGEADHCQKAGSRDQSVEEGSSHEQFDASHYAFFGKDLTEEVELGGLEDEVDVGQFGGFGDEEYGFSSLCNREQMPSKFQCEQSKDTSAVDGVSELTSSFFKLSMSTGERRHPSTRFSDMPVPETAVETDFSKWIDQRIPDSEIEHEERKLLPQQMTSKQKAEGNDNYTPSPYYQDQQWSGDVRFCQTSFNPSVRPPVMQNQTQSNLIRHPPCLLQQGSLTGSHIPHFSGPQPHIRGLFPSLPEYGEGMPQYDSLGYVINTAPHQQGHWLNQPNFHSGHPGSLLSNLMQQKMLQPNLQMPAEMLLQHQRLQSMHVGCHVPPVPILQMLNSICSTPHAIEKHGKAPCFGNMRDQTKSQQCGRQNQHYLQESSTSNHPGRNNNGCQQFHSKYMTREEIESIFRMQHASSHSNNPYVDDYYHEAVVAKNTAGTPRKHSFAPSSLCELPSHTRAAAEQNAFFQVDGLGRVPFSSIHRPRPLHDQSVTNASGDTLRESNSSNKPLEQESMVAVRIVIEDGLCLLLDVDDINRLLQVSQHPDDNALRRRRQFLLEYLAASLQLVDPLVADNGGHSVGLALKDDLVFLQMVSLLKGRKLLSKYIQLLDPGSELARIVSMAVFRHLRFLFGGLPADSSAAATTTNLAKSMTSSVRNMDLSTLSACLAAVACSTEQPPLRPLGSSAGDGATVILKAVLERATNLLTDPLAAYTMSNRALWQASFDAFFTLLSKYCSNKYDSIMDSLIMSLGNSAAATSAAALAMNKEMPMELLRAGIPHTNEHQRKLLLELAQRSTGFILQKSREQNLNTAAVPG